MGEIKTRLYLDFDGVLHRKMDCPDQDEAERLGLFRVCRDGGRVFWTDKHFEHVAALAKMLEAFPEMMIYAHTTWRHLFEEQRPDDIVEWLGPLGERFARFVPSVFRGSRYDVIQWDMYHDRYKGHWVAVDDEDDGFSNAGAQANFVHTSKDIGLTPEKLDELARKLRAVPDSNGVTARRTLEELTANPPNGWTARPGFEAGAGSSHKIPFTLFERVGVAIKLYRGHARPQTLPILDVACQADAHRLIADFLDGFQPIRNGGAP